MPRDIGGVIYRHVARALVVNSTGDPVENLTGGQVYAAADPTGTTPLALAEYPSGVALTSVPTSALGLTPDLYVAFPAGAPLEGYIDFPDDNIPAQAITATAAELAEWQRADVLVEVTEAKDAALVAKADAQAAKAAAEQAAANAAVSGTGGVSGFFRVRYGTPTAGAWEFATLDAAKTAGLKDTDTAVFTRAPRSVAPPSWIRQWDEVRIAGASPT